MAFGHRCLLAGVWCPGLSVIQLARVGVDHVTPFDRSRFLLMDILHYEAGLALLFLRWPLMYILQPLLSIKVFLRVSRIVLWVFIIQNHILHSSMSVLAISLLASIRNWIVVNHLCTLVLSRALFAVIHVAAFTFLLAVCRLCHVEAIESWLLCLQLLLCGWIAGELAVVVLEGDARVLEKLGCLLVVEHRWACEALLSEEATSERRLGWLMFMLQSFVGTAVCSLAYGAQLSRLLLAPRVHGALHAWEWTASYQTRALALTLRRLVSKGFLTIVEQIGLMVCSSTSRFLDPIRVYIWS